MASTSVAARTALTGMSIVRVRKPKPTVFTLVERQAVAAWLWDRRLDRVKKMNERHDWAGLLFILTDRRLEDLEASERTRRIALLMYGQGCNIRASGKVYPSDVPTYLHSAARKYDTDPEGLRALVYQGLIDRRNDEVLDENMRRLFKDIGLDPGRYGGSGRYSPEPHWPPKYPIDPFD